MKEQLPPGYSSPTAAAPPDRQTEWQRRNRAWWEANPMRYDWREQICAREFSTEFYREIDRRFFEDAARYLPPRTRPFDRLLQFELLPNWDVLEIGVGSGSHAQLLAPSCKTFTGIDLTEYAVESTSRRFDRFGIRGRVLRMDAEQMGFNDGSFDFIWAWGVIHHSADTERVLREMYRVLRPGGTAIAMVYHRSWLYTYVYTGLYGGIVLGGFNDHSLNELLQLNTDGAIARFYRVGEWRQLAEAAGFVMSDHRVLGQKSEVILMPAGVLKNAIVRWVPDAVARFVTSTLRQGSFLVSTLKKH